MQTLLAISLTAIVTIAPTLIVSAATLGQNDEAFLKTVAVRQQAEIALAQLATQQASSHQVKQLAARVMADHQKAHQEVRLLASLEGVLLPTQLNDLQRKKQEELLQLSGNEFDQAYLQYMQQDRDVEIDEFEQGAKLLRNPELRIWAFGTLPVLKYHVVAATKMASGEQIVFPRPRYQKSGL